MNPENIVLYHTRMQGYVLRNATYGTNLAEARRFSEAEAIAFAKRALPAEGGSILLPVNLDTLNSIRPVT